MDVDQLIKLVRDRAPSDEPLALVRSAVEVSEDVTALADGVVTHFVGEARQAGHSWTEIGDVLGVSKQAVHQKFVKQPPGIPAMGRYTDRAHTLLHNAQIEARSLRHDFVGTEHLLLAVFRDPESLAAVSLADHHVTADAVRSRVENMIGPGHQVVRGEQPLTPRARKVLDHALGEALKLGHNYVGTEHLLLGMMREKNGVAARVLKELGVRRDKLVQTIVSRLAAARAN